MTSSGRRELLVSRGWVQAVVLVVLFGFFVLGLLAYRTYLAKPPTPQRVVDPGGQVLYTAADIRKGQQVFLHNGLMEYGSSSCASARRRSRPSGRAARWSSGATTPSPAPCGTARRSCSCRAS